MISRWRCGFSSAAADTGRQTVRLSNHPGTAPVRAQRWAAALLEPRPATVPASRDSSAAEEVQPGSGPGRERWDRQRGRAPERLRRLHSRPSAPAAHRHAGRRRAARRRGSPPARLRRRDAPGGRLGARRSDRARARRSVPPACLPTPHRRARSAVHAAAPLAEERARWRRSSPASPTRPARACSPLRGSRHLVGFRRPARTQKSPPGTWYAPASKAGVTPRGGGTRFPRTA